MDDQATRCKVCGKVLREWNESKLCSYHNRLKRVRKYVKPEQEVKE